MSYLFLEGTVAICQIMNHEIRKVAMPSVPALHSLVDIRHPARDMKGEKHCTKQFSTTSHINPKIWKQLICSIIWKKL
jgi:hypothetical protein